MSTDYNYNPTESLEYNEEEMDEDEEEEDGDEDDDDDDDDDDEGDDDGDDDGDDAEGEVDTDEKINIQHHTDSNEKADEEEINGSRDRCDAETAQQVGKKGRNDDDEDENKDENISKRPRIRALPDESDEDDDDDNEEGMDADGDEEDDENRVSPAIIFGWGKDSFLYSKHPNCIRLRELVEDEAIGLRTCDDPIKEFNMEEAVERIFDQLMPFTKAKSSTTTAETIRFFAQRNTPSACSPIGSTDLRLFQYHELKELEVKDKLFQILHSKMRLWVAAGQQLPSASNNYRKLPPPPPTRTIFNKTNDSLINNNCSAEDEVVPKQSDIVFGWGKICFLYNQHSNSIAFKRCLDDLKQLVLKNNDPEPFCRISYAFPIIEQFTQGGVVLSSTSTTQQSQSIKFFHQFIHPERTSYRELKANQVKEKIYSILRTAHMVAQKGGNLAKAELKGCRLRERQQREEFERKQLELIQQTPTGPARPRRSRTKKTNGPHPNQYNQHQVQQQHNLRDN